MANGNKLQRLLLGAAAAMIGLSSPNVLPTVPQQAQTTVAPQRSSDTRTPATAPLANTQLNIISQMGGGFTRYAYHKPPVWSGIEKRGNRKGRSRFDYNR